MLRRIQKRLNFPTIVAATAILLVGGAGTAYAANEWTGANIVNGSLTGADIRDGTVKSADILNGGVTSADILNGTLVSADIKDSAIKSIDILNGTILGGDIKDGTIGTADVLDGGITGADVRDDSVAGGGLTAVDLATGSVGATEIATDSVGATEIANDSIDSGEIVDFGLSNQDVGVLFAQVNADGTLANSSGNVTSGRVGATGSYEVDFARSIAQCAFVATVGPAGAGSALGEVNVADRSGNTEAVFVDTNNSDGATADKPFNLVVVC